MTTPSIGTQDRRSYIAAAFNRVKPNKAVENRIIPNNAKPSRIIPNNATPNRIIGNDATPDRVIHGSNAGGTVDLAA